MSSEPLDKIREYLVGEITPMLPGAWDVKPGLAGLGTLSKTTVYVEYKDILPLPEAPMGHARCGFSLTVASALTDIPKAEADVDSAVVDLVLALDNHNRIMWAKAEKKALGDAVTLAWQIDVSVIASTTKTDPEE